LAKDLQGGQARLPFQDVAYDFPEALNDTGPSDSPLPFLGGVIEMVNRWFPRNAVDGGRRDSRQTSNLGLLVTGLEQDLDFVAL